MHTVALLTADMPTTVPGGLGLRLFLVGTRDVPQQRGIIPCVRDWLRRSGLPVEVVLVPPEHRRYAGIYANPALWPSLVGTQHDEKDVYRVIGTAGVQDWGDGEAQILVGALTTADQGCACKRVHETSCGVRKRNARPARLCSPHSTLAACRWPLPSFP